MDPFDPHPGPWIAYSDPDAEEWVVEDANGLEVFWASTTTIGRKTVDEMVRAVNLYKDRS